MSFRPRRWLVVIPLALIAAGSGALHHRLATAHHIPVTALVIWAVGLFALTGQVLLAWCGKPYTCPPPPGWVTVVVPCYNEDAAYLRRVLDSLRLQTRRPDQVIVCDDGSKVSYAGLPEDYPEVLWIRQDNAGKKHAQVACWDAAPRAVFVANIDSDSALDPHALENGLRPFADPRVQAVAGVEWASNWDHNLLTRAIGARSLAFQLFAMSSQSTAAGNVLIAPGAFSLFRASLLRECRDAYLGETFCGVKVTLGDDTALTLFALMRGRVVQQVTAVCFPAYPETISHHLRQWTRWMRASTIRQIWRMRYLRLTSYAWWFSVYQLGGFTAGVAATVLVVAAWPVSAPLLAGALAGLVGWPLILGSRLVCLRRSDQSAWSLLGGIMLMPLAGLWYLTVLRQIRFYGIATCTRQGWVTRAKVEVVLHDAQGGTSA